MRSDEILKPKAICRLCLPIRLLAIMLLLMMTAIIAPVSKPVYEQEVIQQYYTEYIQFVQKELQNSASVIVAFKNIQQAFDDNIWRDNLDGRLKKIQPFSPIYHRLLISMSFLLMLWSMRIKTWRKAGMMILLGVILFISGCVTEYYYSLNKNTRCFGELLYLSQVRNLQKLRNFDSCSVAPSAYIKICRNTIGQISENYTVAQDILGNEFLAELDNQQNHERKTIK